MRETLAAVLVATMLVVAGCAGGVGTDGGVETDGNSDGETDGSAAGATGTVNFYVSDDPGAIGDFEHLNVTVTMVGFQKAGDGDGDGEAEDETEGNETDENESETGDATVNETEDGESVDENETKDDEEESEDAEEENDGGEEDDGEKEDGDRAGWVEYEVENVTVDLTELQGANATQLDALEAPAGEYDKVFIHVGEVEGMLTTGKKVNVKLPSEKLQIESQFEVAANSSIDFVFDVTVFEAGNSGKYILKPVISESGTGDEVDIRERDDVRDEDERDEDERDDDAAQERAGELDAEIQGNVEAGSAATVKASRGGDPVAGATVEVDGDVVGETDADGRLSVDVPADADALEVTVIDGGDETEIERELDRSNGGEQQLLA